MKLTIGKKLSLGFSILIVFFLISTLATYYTLNVSERVNERNSKIYVPSMSHLMEFSNMIIESEKLIANWIFIQSYDDTREKNRLREINRTDYPLMRTHIENISVNWSTEQQSEIREIFDLVDLLFVTHKFVMEELSDFMSYDDPMVLFEIRPMMEPGGSIVEYTNQIITRLNALTEIQQANVENGHQDMYSALENFRKFSIGIGIFMVIGGFLIAFIFVRNITVPIISLRNMLSLMGQGKLPDYEIKRTSDEIGDMSSALSFLIDGLKQKEAFAMEIGRGNFISEFTPLSEEDTLGLSLIEMRESLKQAKEEEEKRKIEDEKRNWATQGVAQFAELLRQNNDNLQELSFNIIKNLVKYMNANQGGVFILNDDDREKHVELTACYAYERRKFLQKKIMLGEGLVGTCLQEGETIFLTEVPDSYISITSGLGDSNPRCILIVPLKLNDEIFGILEIASFKVLEPYQIEFVEKVGESIASTISSVKINIRTTELLHQSQEQSEEMRAQEEEMRQNMEEMHATQEEMERKEMENQAFFTAVNQSVPVLDLSLDGVVKSANKVFCELLGYGEYELDGLSHTQLFEKQFAESADYNNYWNAARDGARIQSDFQLLNRSGASVAVKASLNPIKNKYGATSRIVLLIQKIL